MGNVETGANVKKAGFLMRHDPNGVTRHKAILNGRKLDLYKNETTPPQIIDLSQYKAIERCTGSGTSDDGALSFKIVPKHHSKKPIMLTAAPVQFEEWFKVVSEAIHAKPKRKLARQSPDRESQKPERGRKAGRANAEADEDDEEVKHDADALMKVFTETDGADIQRAVDEFESEVSNGQKDLEIKQLREQVQAMARKNQTEKQQLENSTRKLDRLRAQIAAIEERKRRKSGKGESDASESKAQGKEEANAEDGDGDEEDVFAKMQQKVLEDNKRLKMGSNYAAATNKSRTTQAVSRSSERERKEVCPQVPTRVEDRPQRERRGSRRSRNSRKQAEAEALRASMNAADDLHICWEFNCWSGCNKGRDCLWSHQWLVNEALHPWTGEKLPGIIERYLIDPGCMRDTDSFHNNGRNNEYQGEWDRNHDKRPRWQQDRARW